MDNYNIIARRNIHTSQDTGPDEKVYIQIEDIFPDVCNKTYNSNTNFYKIMKYTKFYFPIIVILMCAIFLIYTISM
jgi:hypothetical protein